MKRPDFSQETLKVRLSIPFYHKGPKDEAEKKVTEAVVKRMTAPEISRFKNAVARIGEERASYVYAIKELLENCVDDFLDSRGEPVRSASIPMLIMQMPFVSAEKLFRFGLMLTRERSLFTTAYKCAECKEENLFDLDPEEPLPADVEKERRFMEDYMDFYHESVNEEGSKTFSVDLDNAIALEVPESLREEIEDSSVAMSHIEVVWPSLGTYMKVIKDSRKVKDVDTWTIFENIYAINDLDPEQSRAILKANGHDKVCRFRVRDWKKIIGELNRYGLAPDHSFQCYSCGFENEVPFDDTNFFDFLKS